MKYGEEVIKLFQYYVDNGINPRSERRIGVVKYKKVIGVYDSIEEANNETEKMEKKHTFTLLCFYCFKLCFEKFGFSHVRSNPRLGGFK